MDENLFRQVKIHMVSKYFTFNESWLRECVQYCVKTHPKIPIEGIQAFAIEQWLLADLRDINNENGCLPKNIIAQKSTILNGCYILQMEKMYDISTSKYKQLNQIRNINVENLKATKEEKSEIYEPKGKRMYQLYLSDGLQEIKAIEYKPIDIFNNILLPGNKLKIIGPIICRRGIILLEKKNTAILGGEVEDLLIENSVENIMARFLNLRENPDPYNDVKKKEEYEKIDVEEEYLNDLVELVRSQDSKDKEILNSLRNNSIVNHRQPEFKLNTEKNPINQNNNSFDDELELLLNDPDLVYEFPSTPNQILTDNLKIPSDSWKINEKLKLENLSNNRQCENDASSIIKIYQNSSELNENSINFEEPKVYKSPTKNDEVKFTNNFSNSSMYDDDFIIIEDDSNECDNSQFLETTFQQNGELINIDFNLKIRKLKSVENLDTNTLNINLNKNKLDEIDFNNVKTFPNDPSENNTLIDSIENDKSKGSQNENKISNQLSPMKSNIIKKPKSLGFKAFQSKIPTDNEEKMISKPFKPLFPKFTSKTMEIKNTVSELFPTECETENIKLSNHNLDMGLKKLLNVPSKSDTEKSPTGTKRLASVDLISNSHQSKTPRLSESEAIYKVEEKIEIANREKYPKNCDVICDLIIMTLTDQVIYKTIKAQVIEIDKLRIKGGIWHLIGVITDGTASLKVNFSSQFMEKILGMSSLKFSTLKKQAKTNSEIELKLKYTLRNGQEKLVKTDWLMHVALIENNIPSVMEGFELSESEKENFKKRLKILRSRQI